MMVERRINSNQAEDAGMYHVVVENDRQTITAEEREEDLDSFVEGARGFAPRREDVEYQISKAVERWGDLNSDAQHVQLQKAIINQIATNYISHKKKNTPSPL
ncbi:expressed unknown protein [Seminavis robusta]|uniref:Uncharacterized protein n=1 Tax=Seminavis robusta TaxID=568900 RepID=A0A9N8ELF2_9STRA|nr:expressed unknown protein [Seminavis robusta]|eukprot:Sro1194_g251240.1 n/a (103) ;mRNA; r:4621-4929